MSLTQGISHVIYIVGPGKGSNVQTFVRLLCIQSHISPFEALVPHHFNVCKHLCNLNVWLIIWSCSRKVDAVLLAASVSFLSPARNRNRNKTSIHYKAIIQFWRHPIANQGQINIDKNMCKPSNIRLFLLTKLQICCFAIFVPALIYSTEVFSHSQ